MKYLGSGKATGKVILIGEHTVVYGEPAIALPFYAAQIETKVYQSEGTSTIDCDYFSGNLEDSKDEIFGIYTLIHAVCDFLNQNTASLHVVINSKLPPRRGLGSSASVSVSIVRALFDAFNTDLSEKTLHDLVNIAEEVHHFNPSGLDANTIMKGKPIFFQKGAAMHVLPIALEGYLVVADTGDTGHTKEAVQKVSLMLKQNPEVVKNLMNRNGELASFVARELSFGSLEAIGNALNESQLILKSFGVSNTHIDRLLKASRNAGALGAKLTGSGMGGCVIALCKTYEDALNIESAMRAAGAVQTWQYNMKEMIG